jgi:hypothetical protein
VSLLAVIGESSMEEHAQVLTSSWTCMLPRIIPAPQALLKPTRPTRLPQVNAAVVGVHNGTLVPTLNYFPNIIHPIEDLPALSFKVLTIKHKGRLGDGDPCHDERPKNKSASTSVDIQTVEDGPGPIPPRRRSTIQMIAKPFTPDPEKLKPRVPSHMFSPLTILSASSFVMTVGLLIWAALIHDGTACLAVGTISLASSIVGYASWWSPVLMKRISRSKVPPGDVVIRTREGAFLLVRCNEDVARELYTGTEECTYYVKTKAYRFLVAVGTFLLMISVVLLGNCDFTMQAAIGVSYIVLNGVYWGASLIEKGKFWDLSSYEWVDVTPDDAKNAHIQQDNSLGGKPSFTRTMWYAIRETKKVGWVRSGGAAPRTRQWDEWLTLAEIKASSGVRNWDAVQMREEIVGGADDANQQAKDADVEDSAGQHVPAIEVPPPSKI